MKKLPFFQDSSAHCWKLHFAMKMANFSQSFRHPMNQKLGIFQREASVTRSQERLICCCCCSCSWKTFSNCTKKVDNYCTAGREACPRNQWISKLVHEISGLPSLSTKLVEINPVRPRNYWNSHFVHKIGAIFNSVYWAEQCLYCFSLTFKKRLH